MASQFKRVKKVVGVVVKQNMIDVARAVKRDYPHKQPRIQDSPDALAARQTATKAGHLPSPAWFTIETLEYFATLQVGLDILEDERPWKIISSKVFRMQNLNPLWRQMPHVSRRRLPLRQPPSLRQGHQLIQQQNFCTRKTSTPRTPVICGRRRRTRGAARVPRFFPEPSPPRSAWSDGGLTPFSAVWAPPETGLASRSENQTRARWASRGPGPAR